MGSKSFAQAQAVPESPMKKMAQVLRAKAAAERDAFDKRVQSGEWGPMPDAGSEADFSEVHVATIEGDDAVREMHWNPNVGAFDYEVGTKLYAAQPAQAAAAAVERPSSEWYSRMIRETEGLDEILPQGGANTAPVVDGGALSAELIRLADIMRDCGRLVSTSGHAERVMRDAAVALSTLQPPAQEAVIRHWSDCATNNRGVPEMLGPCDCGGYIPPAAPPSPPAQEARKPLTAAQMEAGRKAIFSTWNPFCPCDSKTFRKVSEWTERQHGIGESASIAKQVRP